MSFIAGIVLAVQLVLGGVNSWISVGSGPMVTGSQITVSAGQTSGTNVATTGEQGS